MPIERKNFNDWQLMGPAFVPHKDAWGISSIWAPEVIYMDGQYYMYYSATNRFNNNLKRSRCCCIRSSWWAV